MMISYSFIVPCMSFLWIHSISFFRNFDHEHGHGESEAKARRRAALPQGPGGQAPKSPAKASMAARWGWEYSSTAASSPSRIARTRAGVRAEDSAQFQ